MFLLCGCGGLQCGIAALHGLGVSCVLFRIRIFRIVTMLGHRFHPLLPVSGTGTGFDSFPIKGEGDWLGVLDLFTLTFDSSPIKGEGEFGGCVGLVVCPAPHLWIDESLITLCQRVRLQRGRTSFFIVLVPMNGRVKSAMT